MRPKGSKLKDILLFIILLMLLSGAGIFQKQDANLLASKAVEGLNYLPSGTFLKGMAIGYDEALADFLWVQTIGYFGTHARTDQDYRWLTHMLELIIELDPRYESPYEFAGVILPSELDDVDTAIALLEKGIVNIPRHNPRYWLQPFYLGFCYMIYKDQPVEAARYFEQAAAFPQRPPYLPLLVTRLYGSENRPEQGIRLIHQMLNDPGRQSNLNQYYRKSLEKRIKELTAAQQIRMLEDAVAEYVQFYHARPSELYDLVDGYILPFIPTDPFGNDFYLADDGETVISTDYSGKFEIYAKKKQTPKLGIKISSD